MTLYKRVWAMPSANTFDCKPIGELVQHYLRQSTVSIDPFARNKRWATYTNDLNPNTLAEYHLDAKDFLELMLENKEEVDLVIFDPPYSASKLKECYESIGLEDWGSDTRTTGWTKERDLIHQLLIGGGIVVSCGWDSIGMGKGRGYTFLNGLLVCHGACHHDTIVTVEQKGNGRDIVPLRMF